jgi:ATP-dependent Clp protease ATP-binding subunit ClpA
VAVFERFTEAARQSVVLAQEEARELGHDFIAAEHLVLGVARTDPALLDVDEGRLRAAVVQALGGSMKLVDGWIPFRPEAQSAIEHALGVALERGDTHIGPTPLLLALLEHAPVRKLLLACDTSPKQVASRLAAAAPKPLVDDDHPIAPGDARLLLEIVLRGGPVAAWLSERGVDEAAIRERYGGGSE